MYALNAPVLRSRWLYARSAYFVTLLYIPSFLLLPFLSLQIFDPPSNAACNIEDVPNNVCNL